MRVGRYMKLVSVANQPDTSNDADGFYEPCDPATWWCSIDPQGPSGEGRTVQHLIAGRWHPQITMDTRLVYADAALGRDREFFVRGLQNVNERNAELRLVAEEVIP